MERDCESELSKLNIEQNACIYHFGASVIHGQRSNILRLRCNSMVDRLLRQSNKKLRSSQSIFSEYLWLDTIRSNYIVILQEEKK